MRNSEEQQTIDPITRDLLVTFQVPSTSFFTAKLKQTFSACAEAQPQYPHISIFLCWVFKSLSESVV